MKLTVTMEFNSLKEMMDTLSSKETETVGFTAPTELVTACQDLGEPQSNEPNAMSVESNDNKSEATPHDNRTVDEVIAMSVKKANEHLAQFDLDQLREMRAKELAGKNRSRLIAAIDLLVSAEVEPEPASTPESAAEIPATDPPQEIQAESNTLDDVVSALKDFVNRRSLTAGVELLAQFGAAKASEVAPDRYREFIAKCNGEV